MGDLPIHYGAAKRSLLILGVMAFGMTALGGVIAVLGGPVGWVTGGPAGLFFGVCMVVIFYRAFTSAPVLSLTDDGVTAWRYPPLLWEEIDFAETALSNEQVFLVLHAKDHDAYVARFGLLKRKWAQLNARLMEGAVYLSPYMFVVPVQDIAKVINAELARRRKTNT